MNRTRHLLTSLLLLVLFPVAGNKLYHQKDKDVFRDSELRCAVRLDGYMVGFNYEILKAFGKSHLDSTTILLGDDLDSLLKAVAKDSLDILVISKDEFKETPGLTGIAMEDSSAIWVIRHEKGAAREITRWNAIFRGSREYAELVRRFSGSYGTARGWQLSSGVISPYDDCFISCARILGWDWKLLAALAWSESKFMIQAKSPKGAMGIMQMMPVTADRFGVTDALDPEENIAAGTRYLAFLQKTLSRYAEDPEILAWLTIAAYNSGGGRALQDLEGRERSSATRAYVETVMRQYNIFSGKSSETGLLGPDGLGGIDPGDEDAGDQKEEHDDQEREDISDLDHGDVDVDGNEGDEVILRV